MIYFDNAATGGRKPETILTAISSAVKVCANAGRSGHKLSLSCAKLVYDTRETLNEFFDGYGADRVVFTKNCTEALNIALFGVLRQGDHVIASQMEHNSVLRPLEKMRKEGKIEYDLCPLRKKENGEVNIDENALLSLLKPNTRLIAITSASNVTGTIPDLVRILKILPKNILFLCDGAQGAGHFEIKMQEAGIDLLTVAGHKGMFAIQGSGALLFSERVNPEPLLFGGTGSVSVSLEQPDFYPDALESGTLSFPAILSLLEGTRYLQFHQKEIGKKLHTLTEYLLDGLQDLDGYETFSIPNPCGIVAIRHNVLQSEQLAEILSRKYSIATRGGLHCAPTMHEALHTLDGGLLRISFSHYNTKNEIEFLLNALQKIPLFPV